MKSTLGKYLALSFAAGAIDHIVRANVNPEGTIEFTIRPYMVDGETLDFRVNENHLTQLGVVNPLGAGTLAPVTDPKAKLTKDDLLAKVVDEQFQVFGDRLTVCVLTLKSGFQLVGESACVSAANFDRAEGEKWARERAINKLWELEGYLLRERIHAATL